VFVSRGNIDAVDPSYGRSTRSVEQAYTGVRQTGEFLGIHAQELGHGRSRPQIRTRYATSWNIFPRSNQEIRVQMTPVATEERAGSSTSFPSEPEGGSMSLIQLMLPTALPWLQMASTMWC